MTLTPPRLFSETPSAERDHEEDTPKEYWEGSVTSGMQGQQKMVALSLGTEEVPARGEKR